MPTTTNPTPAEVAAMERRIAEGVMEAEAWTGDGWIPLTGFHKVNVPPDVKPLIRIGGIKHRMSDWSPWRDPAAALAVLKKLAKDGPFWIQRVDSKTFEVGLGFPVDECGQWAKSPGHHYGPAVCLLAREAMNR